MLGRIHKDMREIILTQTQEKCKNGEKLINHSIKKKSLTICDPMQQKVPTFTKINFRFLAVLRKLSSTLSHRICENNNFGLLASVLEGWKRGKNHNMAQNSIKNPNTFCGLYDHRWVPDQSFKSYTQFWWSEGGGNEKNQEVAQDTLSYRLYEPPDFGSHPPPKKFLIFEFYIPISN